MPEPDDPIARGYDARYERWGHSPTLRRLWREHDLSTVAVVRAALVLEASVTLDLRPYCGHVLAVATRRQARYGATTVRPPD